MTPSLPLSFLAPYFHLSAHGFSFSPDNSHHFNYFWQNRTQFRPLSPRESDDCSFWLVKYLTGLSGTRWMCARGIFLLETIHFSLGQTPASKVCYSFWLLEDALKQIPTWQKHYQGRRGQWHGNNSSIFGLFLFVHMSTLEEVCLELCQMQVDSSLSEPDRFPTLMCQVEFVCRVLLSGCYEPIMRTMFRGGSNLETFLDAHICDG